MRAAPRAENEAQCANGALTRHVRVQGKITGWNDLRGFGFVSPLEGGERVFVHVSAFPRGSRRPTDGEFVNYTLGTDERDRLCATQVTYVLSQARRPAVRAQTRTAELIAGFLAAAFLGFIALLAIVGRLSWPVACVYFVMSIVAYSAYRHDKKAAQAGARRTNEWILITLGLIGGWPGALFARHRFRHKTRKLAFRVGFWLTGMFNVAGLAWLIAV
jgi:uncharacterized membrane protein YsdA (DUF1294 family)/cold shock CspA family protein